MAAIRISKTRLKTLFCVGRIPKTNKLFLQNIHSNSQEIISSTSSPTMRLFDFLTCGLSKYNNRKREGLCFRVSNSKSPAPDEDIKQDGKSKCSAHVRSTQNFCKQMAVYFENEIHFVSKYKVAVTTLPVIKFVLTNCPSMPLNFMGTSFNLKLLVE